ncbi:hypothetical protein QW180_25265 [Vibrio sinaloensis]|nr:hypothetical protein [Vibrio sinaloensis]
MVSAADEFESRRWGAAQLDQKANEQKLVDAGATIVEMTPAQLKLTADKVRTTVWPQIINDIGSDWSQPILDKALN